MKNENKTHFHESRYKHCSTRVHSAFVLWNLCCSGVGDFKFPGSMGPAAGF
jgi:hypothetical protein